MGTNSYHAVRGRARRSGFREILPPCRPTPSAQKQKLRTQRDIWSLEGGSSLGGVLARVSQPHPKFKSPSHATNCALSKSWTRTYKSTSQEGNTKSLNVRRSLSDRQREGRRVSESQAQQVRTKNEQPTPTSPLSGRSLGPVVTNQVGGRVRSWGRGPASPWDRQVNGSGSRSSLPQPQWHPSWEALRQHIQRQTRKMKDGVEAFSPAPFKCLWVWVLSPL